MWSLAEEQNCQDVIRQVGVPTGVVLPRNPLRQLQIDLPLPVSVRPVTTSASHPPPLSSGPRPTPDAPYHRQERSSYIPNSPRDPRLCTCALIRQIFVRPLGPREPKAHGNYRSLLLPVRWATEAKSFISGGNRFHPTFARAGNPPVSLANQAHHSRHEFELTS